MSSSNEIIVFTTLSDRDLAEIQISEMLQEGIIISGTIFPEVTLMYQWDGKIAMDTENKIMIKARSDQYPKIEEYIMKHHPYLAPEVIKLDVSFGSDNYRKFIKAKIEKAG
ncbi:divalent-cation tolerance protein CutA [Leptospira kmetyi]|uniref:Divalent-cation tolerance protein CutA n=1 Tax=Leptospira kmetyi TaxID=408139 RepID=A0A2M9XJW2_9LEPT|nr:divalent-cation tolerance protein CutA [Leptospira kmetyi]AYV55412.1 divalent-cation tolerance protein CutA [Leptospira kmetyi]EQA53335.1 divalent cation tolerance protein, CutA1 family [Leptospira kmetyi serovar Malaysia str. Bejo-Iso9]PJZ28825.1 divalent-cation tolerance protein CutA [Leptospira kmetyi]PJZ39602.1 divalent-cation tolerance protein CutA [Leptospira kmetyi]TGK16790.1 divalent-cation tolerance protein CutA [Leptospira kmetyi]